MKSAVKNIDVNLNGEPRQLRFNLWALFQAEKEIGRASVMEILQMENVFIGDMLALLWAGLIHEGKNETIEELGCSLDLSDVPAIYGAIKDALIEQFVSGDPGKNAAGQEAEQE